MAYLHAGPAGSQVVEVACNLKDCSSAEGCPEFVLARVSALAASEGVSVLHSYNTNPTPAELESLISHPDATAGHVSDDNKPPLDWRVPPGEEPFSSV
mmetsp:Transcript_43063/g.86397  ORF Transcript_43063/g.86397 Transcript_43063/m.86397 type:complete len:98 (+) Transcript_43063:757-1050(+)